MAIIKNNSWLMLFVLFTCFSLKSHVSFGADTVSANQSLSGDQTIVSKGGVFAFGFFNPAPDGNLVLFNESQLPIWSTNLTATSRRSVEAVLLDEGNLVLRDLSNNLSKPLWQSFDHPAHTWIPGMKLTFNKRNNVSQLITSWKNKENPAPGLFSLERAPDGSNQYVMLWNRSEQYWSSGPWDENAKIFSMVPEMNQNYIYNFSYVSNENESYFTYNVKDSTYTSRAFMDVSGQDKQMNWLPLPTNSWFLFWSQPRQQCEVYALCGQFSTCNQQTERFCSCLKGFQQKSVSDWNLEDYSGGCVRKTPLQCENISPANRKSDQFFQYSNMKLPKHPQSVAVGGIRECETHCMNNCSCTAYAYKDNACSIWVGSFVGLQQLQGGGDIIYIKLAASEFESPKNKKGVVIGGVVGSVAVVALIGLIMLVYLGRRKTATVTTKTVEGSLVAFAYKDLQTATKNFSKKLGGGGFGSVFKGVFPNSSLIAVKKLESLSQGEKQFRTEVRTIGNIQHVNLVRLLGFCSEGTSRLLVYDFMPNGSLDSHLFTEKDSAFLDWKTRYQIALGTARGLAYLHEKCRDCIIHCDIKPENILLDAEFCPKVSDFGLAKLVGREFSRVLTTMRGTRGYLAPEWISGVAITAKADVYSYGMMLFEFVSGRRNSQESEDGKVKFFPSWAAKQIVEGSNLISLLDPRLEGNADEVELARLCKVACWCIQDDETHRPSMGQVVQILEGVLDVTLPPIPRALQVMVDDHEHVVFFTESSTSQSSLSKSNNSTASSQAKSTTSSRSS
ncbi:G-type lectin S-receptor-like serine/threonine-protein kinase At2g19130 [Citrus clementina]|uniref:G-type lectin S-receptor-like serine/threonine-protein kinase At2g19130 n=1 Tax=Citrus clementina TaxID=85681 RepID=UPI000CED1192|nr:G-type lectin S-receptor-like serine/threonine-protein kinase At2g19130 [Citrus x clementina]